MIGAYQNPTEFILGLMAHLGFMTLFPDAIGRRHNAPEIAKKKIV